MWGGEGEVGSGARHCGGESTAHQRHCATPVCSTSPGRGQPQPSSRFLSASSPQNTNHPKTCQAQISNALENSIGFEMGGAGAVPIGPSTSPNLDFNATEHPTSTLEAVLNIFLERPKSKVFWIGIFFSEINLLHLSLFFATLSSKF